MPPGPVAAEKVLPYRTGKDSYRPGAAGQAGDRPIPFETRKKTGSTVKGRSEIERIFRKRADVKVSCTGILLNERQYAKRQ